MTISIHLAPWVMPFLWGVGTGLGLAVAIVCCMGEYLARRAFR